MGVLEEAIALEERAQEMYLEASRRMVDPGATMLTELLADEEGKHADALREMQHGADELPAGLAAPPLLDEIHELVGAAIEGGGTTLFEDASMRDVLLRAMEMERQAERFYTEHAESAEDPLLRELFTQLGRREMEHFLLASSLHEYFDRPTEWVESAEFGVRPEY
ncbi:MAG: ferritin family protein [Candidatus Bipolaricaulota bacterium]|nr:MAG: ferritin family protein [Candidatus Bipolaricaulota bacterium]